MKEESVQATITKEGSPKSDALAGTSALQENSKDAIFEESAESAAASVVSKVVSKDTSIAQAIVKLLEQLKITESFGVSGGAMATLWAALSDSYRIEVIHCRHESGATFAATEASLAGNRPVAAFCTAGPGLTNALTGMFAARGEGAKVVLLSACTSAAQRGRWAIQETSELTLPQAGLFESGALFNYATVVESAQQLPEIYQALAEGFARPDGFVAHLSFPTVVQSQQIEEDLPDVSLSAGVVAPDQQLVQDCAQKLSSDRFAIWVGYGARNCAQKILSLAEKTGAAVMCSPRGKGIFPEDHPQFVGVTGLGGHSSVLEYMETPPRWTLVLGTRMGEPTSFWSKDLLPTESLIHVDVDPKAPKAAYKDAETIAVRADIDSFLTALLPLIEEQVKEQTEGQSASSLPHPLAEEITPGEPDCVRPEFLMQMVQQEIVEKSDAVVLAESGNSFTWSTHWLRFNEANRYRVSTGVGAMGHAVTGVIGAAKATGRKAVAISGDGSMLMNNEISTAVKYKIPAVWIVLNDARYNMCFQGMALLGLKADALMPDTDFVMIAKGMGAEGVRVEQEADLPAALTKAMASEGPFVVDVQIDATRQAPSKGRNKGLIAQKSSSAAAESGANGNGVGKAQENGGNGSEPVSFPLV